MGFIIYGRRAYGRVHQHEGEYADTQFAHVDFVPLFPISSFWVTQDQGNGQRYGFPIKLNGKSVLATYLRVWGPIAAAILLGTSHAVGTTVAGLVIVALSVWSWTWRSRRGELVQRRSDFDHVALGSRCDPAWMTDDMRLRLADKLETKLAARPDARPPDDVARFGARDVDEALLAYGVLRVSSVKHRRAGAAADRLLASAFDQLPQDGGPYREATASPSPALGPAIVAAARVAAATHRPAPRRRWFHNPWVQLVALGLLTFNVAVWGAHQLRPTVTVGDHDLSGMRPPTGEHVRVQCDRIENDDWQLEFDGKVEQQITFCWLGHHVLPIVTKDELDLEPTTIEGELRGLDQVPVADEAWVTELRRDSDLDNASYADLYLLREKGDHFDLVIAIAAAVATLAGWLLWLRALVRRRGAKA